MRIPDGELKKLLLDSGLVKQQDLDDAIPKDGDKEPLDQIVLKKKLISEKDLVKLYAKSLDLPFVELNNVKSREKFY